MIGLLALGMAWLGVLALAGGYLAGGQPVVAAALLGLGVVWLVARWRGWRWLFALGLAAITLAAGVGLGRGYPAGWLVAGVTGGLLAWDLAAFDRRLSLAAPTDDVRALIERHLVWLACVVCAGLLLGAIAPLLRLDIGLGWSAALALITAFGLGRLVSRLRQG